jgi:YesN/AraC family two-component response regulator
MAKPQRFKENQFISELQQFMDKHHIENITVYGMAAYFEVNAATLRRWFKEYVNASPKEYIARYRLIKAKELLRQKIKPSDISKKLGFNELKTFCTVFKRFEKMTPSEFSKLYAASKNEIIGSAQTNNDNNGLNGE